MIKLIRVLSTTWPSQSKQIQDGYLYKVYNCCIEYINAAIIFSWPNWLNVSCCITSFIMQHVIFYSLLFQNKTVIPHLINIISKSLCTQDCITTLFSRCCTVSIFNVKMIDFFLAQMVQRVMWGIAITLHPSSVKFYLLIFSETTRPIYRNVHWMVF